MERRLKAYNAAGKKIMDKPIHSISFHCACGYGPVSFSFHEHRLWQCPSCLRAMEVKVAIRQF